MDPNECLNDIRALSAQILAILDKAEDPASLQDQVDIIDAAEHLATVCQSLDKWLVGGGFPPESWSDD